MSEISLEDKRRLQAAGALVGDGVIVGHASAEDAKLAYAEHQREWVEQLLPCIEGVHAVIESGQDELLVACNAHALSAVLATMLEQGFVGVRVLEQGVSETPT